MMIYDDDDDKFNRRMMLKIDKKTKSERIKDVLVATDD